MTLWTNHWIRNQASRMLEKTRSAWDSIGQRRFVCVDAWPIDFDPPKIHLICLQTMTSLCTGMSEHECHVHSGMARVQYDMCNEQL